MIETLACTTFNRPNVKVERIGGSSLYFTFIFLSHSLTNDNGFYMFFITFSFLPQLSKNLLIQVRYGLSNFCNTTTTRKMKIEENCIFVFALQYYNALGIRFPSMAFYKLSYKMIVT